MPSVAPPRRNPPGGVIPSPLPTSRRRPVNDRATPRPAAPAIGLSADPSDIGAATGTLVVASSHAGARLR